MDLIDESKWTKGIPPNTGDNYLVLLDTGKYAVIAFCPQQGWIDDNWNTFSEKSICKYQPN